MKDDRIPKPVNENTLNQWRTVCRIRGFKDQHAWRQKILDVVDPLDAGASDKNHEINVPEEWN